MGYELLQHLGLITQVPLQGVGFSQLLKSYTGLSQEIYFSWDDINDFWDQNFFTLCLKWYLQKLKSCHSSQFLPFNLRSPKIFHLYLFRSLSLSQRLQTGSFEMQIKSRDLFWPKQSLDFLKIGINWQQLEIRKFPQLNLWSLWKKTGRLGCTISMVSWSRKDWIRKDCCLMCTEPVATIKSFMWSAWSLGRFELMSPATLILDPLTPVACAAGNTYQQMWRQSLGQWYNNGTVA